MSPMWQYGMEHNLIESAGCVATHASNMSDDYYNPKKQVFQDSKHVVVEGGVPINVWQMDRGTIE